MLDKQNIRQLFTIMHTYICVWCFIYDPTPVIRTTVYKPLVICLSIYSSCWIRMFLLFLLLLLPPGHTNETHKLFPSNQWLCPIFSFADEVAPSDLYTSVVYCCRFVVIVDAGTNSYYLRAALNNDITFLIFSQQYMGHSVQLITKSHLGPQYKECALNVRIESYHLWEGLCPAWYLVRVLWLGCCAFLT